MRILVTGITGFAGSHLAEALLAQGVTEIAGACRQAGWPAVYPHLAQRIPLNHCELTDGVALEAILRRVQPTAIYHLAGYANAGQSLKDPDAAWEGNLDVTRSLYEAVMRWGGTPRILFVGSGLVYGDTEGSDQEFDERAPLFPVTPYAASKAAADLASYQYFRSAGLDIVRVRPFNHIGPRQAPQFAVAHFAQQIAAIERGRQPPILETGNLTPRRDLTDVRDIVRAYMLVTERGRSGEVYNVGSGQSHTMQSVLDRLLALTKIPIEVRQKSVLVRKTETAAVCANATKLRQETGWAPGYSLDQSLADTLEYWRLQP